MCGLKIALTCSGACVYPSEVGGGGFASGGSGGGGGAQRCWIFLFYEYIYKL